MFSPMFNLSLVKPCFFHDFLIILLCKLALRKAREHHAFEACDMFVEESGGHLRWFEPEKPWAPLEIAIFFVVTNRFKF